MLIQIFRKVGQQLVMVLVVSLILFATYLSIGRQFMPAVTGYKTIIEEQITDVLGLPVTIESLTGYFDGFNPAIRIQGLRVHVNLTGTISQQDTSSFEFESSSIILNVAQTIRQRQIVLENFVIEGMKLNAQQRKDGTWQLSGIDLGSSSSFNFDSAYETIQQVSRLELTNLSIELQALSGNTTQLHDITAIIQNSSGNHYIHINTSMGGSDSQILMSVEVTGDTLDELSGVVHISLPRDDYSAALANEGFGGLTLGEVVGGGHAWVTYANRQVQSVILQPTIDRLSFSLNEGNMLTFNDISGKASLLRHIGDDSWEAATENFGFSWKGSAWAKTDAHVHYRTKDVIQLKLESISLNLAREVILDSGMANDGLTEQLVAYEPAGILRNLSMVYPLARDSENQFKFAANTENIAVNEVPGTPGMSGITGYVEVNYDSNKRLANGFAEVESENFNIEISKLFVDTWNYDYVNGRVYFRVDQEAQQVKISSSMIVAESEIVDGRAQFSSNIVHYPDGEELADFNLLVGARRIDGSKKSPYLPSAPTIKQGLRNTMQWLDRAVLDAAVFDSGVIFRGSTLRDAIPEEKSFQAFFAFDQGQLDYVEAWPEITEVAGKVVVDDEDVDILVDSGRSMNLNLAATTGRIRREANGEKWLTINGEASGETRAGLKFLSEAPINNELGQLVESWQAEGQVVAELKIKVPLGVPSAKNQVELSAQLADNKLVLPNYQLQFDEVTGLIKFDSKTGLHDSNLQSRFFDDTASISLSSVPNEGGSFVTEVEVIGSAANGVLAQWSGQSQFVRDVLQHTAGEVDYTAKLNVQQDRAGRNMTRLEISSNLQGVEILLPQPFRKGAVQPMPLNLVIDFDTRATRVKGSLGSQLSLQVALKNDALINGIVYLGTIPGVADPWRPNTSSGGLEVRGNLDVFVLNEWLDTLTISQSGGSPASDFSQWVSKVELDVGTLDIFGQQLQSVNVQIEDFEHTNYWTIGLISDAVTGSVLFPFDKQQYIEAYLAFLHLPGNGSEASPEPGVVVTSLDDSKPESPIDPLAQLDPREIPRLKFFTGNFSIGDKDYGLGQFTLDPTPEGAEFSEVIGNFRGFKVGTDSQQQPHLSWHYDGSEHHSYLTGIVAADNLADVLLANGYAATLMSQNARFTVSLDWRGTPANFAVDKLSGNVLFRVEEGRFIQGGSGTGALKLISILNFDAIMRRLRFSDDLLRSGLAYEEITGDFALKDGVITIKDQLVINGPSSVYQISGQIDLANKTIDGLMYVTLPFSNNIPWVGLLTANIPLAIGAFLFDRLFSNQLETLTSAEYTLKGPWEGLQPQFKQAFSSAPQAKPPINQNPPAVPPAL